MTRMAKAAKAVQLDHHHFGASPDDPEFNIELARAAHADVMKRWDDPDEGDDFKALMMHTIQNLTALEIEAHRDEIQKFLDDFGTQQKAELSKAIVKSYVEGSIVAAQEVGKADRVWRESEWKRDHGQFASFLGSRGGERPGTPLSHQQQAPGSVDMAANLHLLRQAAAISAAAGGKGQGVIYHIRSKDGKVRQEMPGKGRLPKLGRGESLIGPRGQGIRDADSLTMNDVGFNLAQALGASASGARDATDFAGRSARAGKDFNREWVNYSHSNYGNDTGRAYRHIKAGADALDTIAAGSPKAQAAVAIGRYVGSHGAEAEKVLGPHSRKTSYKYRGIERAPRGLPAGQERMSPRDYHDVLTARLSESIPSATVHALNLSSGYTAPSQGYLLDGSGKVIAEAHGYGDDHYLPFRLSGLTRMKEGSYIRTRSTGGPTTEDIYAATVSGAKGFTVTSRQGTYEVAFDPSFSHNKRFGDIPSGMSRRYGKLLDAVANGKVKVRGDVTQKQYQGWYEGQLGSLPADDPDREAKAHKYAADQAKAQESAEGRELHLDGEGYDYALKALKSQYPYYIGSVTYSKTSDRRFLPVDENGNEKAREGWIGEQDTGYVKARHIKSAEAMVGYWDKSIAGNVKDENGVMTGQGKVRGDLAHYQNWKHNPYRTTAARPSAPPDPRRDAASTGSGGTMTNFGGVGSNATQQGSQYRQDAQGGGRKDINGVSKEVERLHGMVRDIQAHHEHNGTEMPEDMAKWLDKSRLANNVSSGSRRASDAIAEMHQKVTGRMTDTSIPRRDDEAPDAVLSDLDYEKRVGELHVFLNQPQLAAFREHLSYVADEMSKDPAHQDRWGRAGKVEGLGWGNYQMLPKDDLIKTAIPQSSGTAEEVALNRRIADKLITYEREISSLEEGRNVPIENRWSPPEPDADAPDTEAGKPDPNARAKSVDQGRLAHAAAVNEALRQVIERHQEADHSGSQQWREERLQLDGLARQWERSEVLDPDDRDQSYEEADQALGDVLADMPSLGRIPVTLHSRSGEGHGTNLSTVHRVHSQVGKRFTIAKRGSRYVIKRAA